MLHGMAWAQPPHGFLKKCAIALVDDNYAKDNQGNTDAPVASAFPAKQEQGNGIGDNKIFYIGKEWKCNVKKRVGSTLVAKVEQPQIERIQNIHTVGLEFFYKHSTLL